MTAASAVAVAAGFAWPVLSHGAALAGRSELMPAITAVTVIVILGAVALGVGRVWLRVLAIAAMVAVVLAWRHVPALLVYLPPSAINLALGIYFASTLAPGREPRISGYARRLRGEPLSPEHQRYTRRLTWIWTVFFFASMAIEILLAVTAPIEVWSAFSNLVSYLLVALLFVGEHFWRRLKFPNQRQVPMRALLKMIVRDRRVGPANR